jgi:hypothetical protein
MHQLSSELLRVLGDTPMCQEELQAALLANPEASEPICGEEDVPVDPERPFWYKKHIGRDFVNNGYIVAAMAECGFAPVATQATPNLTPVATAYGPWFPKPHWNFRDSLPYQAYHYEA